MSAERPLCDYCSTINDYSNLKPFSEQVCCRRCSFPVCVSCNNTSGYEYQEMYERGYWHLCEGCKKVFCKYCKCKETECVKLRKKKQAEQRRKYKEEERECQKLVEEMKKNGTYEEHLKSLRAMAMFGFGRFPF